ncbi:hypothetical protein NE237_007651 [Protea cynaroides]|uniref:Uncharacterized protein n=1 Tax=Protea cynaroides TaxID=273540 RepID=A0A9Q0KPT1_9MAGN|nr:hypothetical protein NE237_007651 [Protea cynaroides]
MGTSFLRALKVHVIPDFRRRDRQSALGRESFSFCLCSCSLSLRSWSCCRDLEEENVRRAMSANKQTLEIDEDRRRQMFRGASSSGHTAELQGRTQRRRKETVDLNPQPQIPPPFRRSQKGSGFRSSS